VYGRGFCACARIPFHTHLPSEARRERRSTFSSARMRTEGAKRDEKGEALSRQPVCEQRERSETRKAKHFLVSPYANRGSEASEKGEALSRQPICEQKISEASEKGEALSRQPVCEQRERSERERRSAFSSARMRTERAKRARKAKRFLVSLYANRESEARRERRSTFSSARMRTERARRERRSTFSCRGVKHVIRIHLF